MLNTEYYVATTLTLCDGSDRLCVLLIYIEVLRSCIFLGLWRNIVDFLDLSGNRRLVQTLQNVALRFPPPNFVKLGGNLSFDCSAAVGLLRNQCCKVSFWQKYGSRFIFFRNPYRSGWCSGGFSWVESSKFARRTPIILTWTIACHFASGTLLAGRTSQMPSPKLRLLQNLAARSRGGVRRVEFSKNKWECGDGQGLGWCTVGSWPEFTPQFHETPWRTLKKQANAPTRSGEAPSANSAFS